MDKSDAGRTACPKIGMWYGGDTGSIHLSIEGQGFSTVNPNPESKRGTRTCFANLPDIHRDPIDRMLVAHALEDGMTLVTADANIRLNPVPIV